MTKMMVFRRRALIGGQGQILDTTPIITERNKQLTKSGGTEAASGLSVTAKYKVPWEKGMAYCFRSGDTAAIKPICAWTGTETNFNTSWSRSLNGGSNINVNYSFENCWLALTVATDYIDYCYLYEMETGFVVYAGKNTPYYGKHNIND